MKDDRFQVVDVVNKRGHGTCWARHTIQHLYCEEEFTLAIDSHHRFVPGWDSKLKSMYYYLQQKGHPKPLLTGYVTSYKPWLENSDDTGEYSLEMVLNKTLGKWFLIDLYPRVQYSFYQHLCMVTN
jgi:hypothetical protein